MQYFLVFITVLITIASSLMVDYASELKEEIDVLILVLLALVIGVNAFKFVLWGWIHKNYDVSQSYPLTAMFFPMVLMLSYWQGETGITFNKVIGTILIVLGLLLLGYSKNAIESAKMTAE